jgi:hypothetical protein
MIEVRAVWAEDIQSIIGGVEKEIERLRRHGR